jgi:uncharacterized protein
MKQRISIIAFGSLFALSSACAQATVFLAATNGTPQEVQAAIDKGEDVNAYSIDMTPLISAAAHNSNPEVITALLKASANIEARDLRYGIGGTALLWAAYANPNPKVIVALLSAGASIEARTADDRTALIWAARDNPNPAEVIMVLLNAGADAKAMDKTGMTAVDAARYNPKLKGTEALKRLEEASH